MFMLKKYYKNNFLRFLIITSFLLLSSCQKIEVLDNIVFDNNLLDKISIAAEKKIINIKYESSFFDSFVDHSMSNPPISRLESWLSENVAVFGSENYLVIDIINASIKKTEVLKDTKKKFAEKSEYLYKIYLSLDFKLFNDSNEIISSIQVSTKRSTTSGKFISLSQKDHIMDMLILDALIDISSKSNELLFKNMNSYIL